MAYVAAKFGIDRSRVTVVPVRCHPGRRDAGNRLGRPEEGSGSRHVACFAQPDIYQGTRCIDGSIEIAPATLDLHVRLVHIPAFADLAAAAPASQILSQGRCELCLPVTYRLVAED